MSKINLAVVNGKVDRNVVLVFFLKERMVHRYINPVQPLSVFLYFFTKCVLEFTDLELQVVLSDNT